MNLITPILSFLSQTWKNYTERKQAQHNTELAVEQGRQKLVEKEMDKLHELNIERLKSTKAWFKYFTFLMWFGPFMISWAFPSYGVQIFENLKLLPEWYVQSCMMIMFTVWGIAVGSSTISAMFTSLGRFFERRSQARVARKAVYDVIRAAKGRSLSQKEVDIIGKGLDYIDSAKK